MEKFLSGLGGDDAKGQLITFEGVTYTLDADGRSVDLELALAAAKKASDAIGAEMAGGGRNPSGNPYSR